MFALLLALQGSCADATDTVATAFPPPEGFEAVPGDPFSDWIGRMKLAAPG